MPSQNTIQRFFIKSQQFHISILSAIFFSKQEKAHHSQPEKPTECFELGVMATLHYSIISEPPSNKFIGARNY